MRCLAFVMFLTLCFGLLGLQAQDAQHPLNVGGDVKAPIIIRQADPDFSHVKMPPKVPPYFVLSLVVDEHGVPHKVAIVRGMGEEIDQHAVEAVQQYRFKPATRNGQPVAVKLKLEINIDPF